MMSGSTPEQLAGMLARIALEPDDGRAAALAEQYAAAFTDAVVEAWGRRLDRRWRYSTKRNGCWTAPRSRPGQSASGWLPWRAWPWMLLGRGRAALSA
jgi:hypothetical protein